MILTFKIIHVCQVVPKKENKNIIIGISYAGH